MTTGHPLTVVKGFWGLLKIPVILYSSDLTFIPYVVARDMQQIITPNLSFFVNNNKKKPAQQVNTYWSKQHQTSKLK